MHFRQKAAEPNLDVPLQLRAQLLERSVEQLSQQKMTRKAEFALSRS